MPTPLIMRKKINTRILRAKGRRIKHRPKNQISEVAQDAGGRTGKSGNEKSKNQPEKRDNQLMRKIFSNEKGKVVRTCLRLGCRKTIKSPLCEGTGPRGAAEGAKTITMHEGERRRAKKKILPPQL